MSTPKKSKRPAKANALAALPLRVAVAVVNASDWLKLPRHAVEAFLKKLDGVDIRVGSIARGPSRDELTLAKLLAVEVQVNGNLWRLVLASQCGGRARIFERQVLDILRLDRDRLLDLLLWRCCRLVGCWRVHG